MNGHPASITHISWGKMEVTVGESIYHFKDCKIWPEGAKEWDWNQTGTRHQPGIQPADIAEILDQKVDVMVLSRGMDLMLHTSKETVDLLMSCNIKFHIEETKKAVALFNELIKQGHRAGGIFHSTC